MGVLDFAPTHSKLANMTFAPALHPERLLAKATELLLAQGVDLVHSSSKQATI